MDERDEELLGELAGWPWGLSPEELVRILGWPKKTVYGHLKNLENSGRVGRSGTGKSGRGVRLVAVEDGTSTEDRYRHALRQETSKIVGRARREGRGLSPSELMDCLRALARTAGPPWRGRGRPHRRRIPDAAELAWLRAGAPRGPEPTSDSAGAVE
jgi:hypothetical protein